MSWPARWMSIPRSRASSAAAARWSFVDVVITNRQEPARRHQFELRAPSVAAKRLEFRRAYAKAESISIEDDVAQPTSELPAVDDATSETLAQPSSATALPTLPADNTDKSDRRSLADVRATSWIALAAGVVALGVGGGFYAASQATENDIESAPTETAADLSRLQELEDTGDRQRTLGVTFLVLGGVATAAGVGLVTWDLTRESEATRVSVAPIDRRGGFAVTVQGSFQ